MKELLLLDLAGFRYGVWKKDIFSHEVQTIHWLTNSDGAVTAIAMMGVHPVSLADLSYCIGLPPIHKDRTCLVLSLTDQDVSVSFVVQKDSGRVQVPSAAIFPIPSYLQTSFVDTCVLIESNLVPLINLREIYRCVQNSTFEPPLPALQFPAEPERNLHTIDHLRVFTCDTTSFAAPADIFSPEPAQLGQITELALTPEFVWGITFHNNQVLTIIDIGQRMELSSGRSNELLIAEIAGQGFAFSVEEDQGTLPADTIKFEPLPTLAQSDWLRTVVLRSRQIIPLVDFKALLSNHPNESDKTSSLLKLKSNAQFQSVFGKEQVDIVEFSLFNTVHALPRQEVMDSIPFTSCQTIPDTRILVAGVASHEGELLPVLDLARCFGRESKPTSHWRLLLVHNGDLRVLIMAEKVFGERALKVNMQRSLPFIFPRSSVYGCYPAESQVRLILNVLALTAHFDNEQIHDLLLFSDEMNQSTMTTDAFLQNNSVLDEGQNHGTKKPLGKTEHTNQDNLPAINAVSEHALLKQTEILEQKEPWPLAPDTDHLTQEAGLKNKKTAFSQEDEGTAPSVLPDETNSLNTPEAYGAQEPFNLTEEQAPPLQSTLAAVLQTDNMDSLERATDKQSVLQKSYAHDGDQKKQTPAEKLDEPNNFIGHSTSQLVDEATEIDQAHSHTDRESINLTEEQHAFLQS
ncbi:MAG: hypothetical protein D3924_06985, partial [Candidatus Electrothrix sp. AR4]|nr:hypothetical protein [Candidatus Electrothrix sp. AR4]